MATTLPTRQFWICAPGRGEIVRAGVPARQPGELLVRTLFSAISRGTESLVFAGAVPPSQYAVMRAPGSTAARTSLPRRGGQRRTGTGRGGGSSDRRCRRAVACRRGFLAMAPSCSMSFRRSLDNQAITPLDPALQASAARPAGRNGWRTPWPSPHAVGDSGIQRRLHAGALADSRRCPRSDRDQSGQFHRRPRRSDHPAFSFPTTAS
jgi:hypothetical protein